MSRHRLALSTLFIAALLAPGIILAQPTALQVAFAPEAQAGSLLFIENAGQWPYAARFQVRDGLSGTTTISASLPTANGSYPLPLIPAVGATTGQTLTVRVDIGPVMLSKDGWISRPVYLPLLLRR